MISRWDLSTDHHEATVLLKEAFLTGPKMADKRFASFYNLAVDYAHQTADVTFAQTVDREADRITSVLKLVANTATETKSLTPSTSRLAGRGGLPSRQETLSR